ncbi:unnamed protein product [Clonostachys chloroleuca]|uniref:F-box domain-containing protein n=1 Tax=Clonostachys chloroleuca TaxID=1926264 RepID=A0AA35VEM9_9HYPO|nr:unnamed protein product [Clonostachys chloroleuca]
MPLDQPPPYRLVEGSASRRDDERGPAEDCTSKKDDERGLAEESISKKDDERGPVEDSASRKDDERAVSPCIQITAPPKKSLHWWRSLLGSRSKKPHDPPKPVTSSRILHAAPYPGAPFLKPHDPTRPPAFSLKPIDPPQPVASCLELHGPPQLRESFPDPPQYSPMPPKAEGPRRIYERTSRPRQESPVFKLPKPVLIKIMMGLSPISLWSLRQASALFRTLFDDRQFYSFHDKVGLHDAHIKFSTGIMSEEERREARAMLQPRKEVERWCTACTRVRLRGEFEPAVIKLRELRFCDACGERHAGIFFPQESIERGDENLVCIGRLGKWELCSHMEPIMWDSLKDILSVPNIEKYGRCPHPEHQRCSKKGSTKYSSFPRMLLIRRLPPNDSHTTIKIGWDLPLLDIDSRDPPSTAGIRRTLQQLIVGGALRNHKTCPHMADGKALSDFISAAVCDCFRKPAWLSLLDDIPTLAGIFHEKNKHIFWCDSPGCATGRDIGLWQDMVKEEMGLHHERYEEPNMELCDWFTHLRRSRKLGYSQIRMPPRATVPKLPGFLHAVRVAAKGEFQNYAGP